MTIHRFYISEDFDSITVGDGELFTLLNTEVIHQMKKVLRLREGTLIELFDGTGEVISGKIDSLDRDGITVEQVSRFFREQKFKTKLTLAAAMIKKDKYEWVLQKGTEIGVTRFAPIISDRTEKVQLNMKRAEKIVIEACEQSGKVAKPVVTQPVDLEMFVRETFENIDSEKVQMFYLDFDGIKMTEAFNKPHGDLPDEMMVFVGPEGGWSDADKEIFKQYQVTNISIGNGDGSQILRAETAAISIASLLLL